VALPIITSGGQQTLQTSALTVGQALVEAGYILYAADQLDPPAGTSLDGPLTVTYTPSREYTVSMDGKSVVIRSAAATVGQALAEAGIPLQGLDYSLPVESAPLPEDRQIRLVRVVETVTLTQKSIPFTTLSEYSADLELDQQAFTQPGAPGLAVSRVRVRSEDGVEVSCQPESESVVRPLQDRVVSYGTRVVMHTTTVDGITITYWRALQFWATSYHPAETGSDITASGRRLQKGLVGIDPDYIPYGTQMYIPSYGFAEAADTGSIIGRWIDLGYRDDDYVAWHQWVTVYFLWPPPAVIPYNIPPPTTTWGFIPPPP
jgi:3D (Asp-Asp-Asp) domain-containing protein